MRLIDADALYERLKSDEDLARQRVIDTPNSFPNGMLNPAAVRYQAQLAERTRLKEIVYDAPTIEERKKGKWMKWEARNGLTNGSECSECGYITSAVPNYGTKFCPHCGADMRGEQDE